MSYLTIFQKHITAHDFPSFLKIWEEYCCNDNLDEEEVIAILKRVKSASFCEEFGKHVHKILPLWQLSENTPLAREIFRLVIDIDSLQDPARGEEVYQYLQKQHGSDPLFLERIKWIGLRSKEKYRGSVSNYELLAHLQKGNFVFHTAGWGVGMVIDVSLVREQVTLEFDYVAGKKDLSFAIACKTLLPLPKTHFLAERFGDPDALEKKAKEHPVEVIHMLLRDLGPKDAGEIKDELCELVIPAEQWTKWWQNARAKLKKDTLVEVPEDLKSPFILRKAAVTHEQRLEQALENKPDANTLIQMVYSFIKDFPETLKNAEFTKALDEKLCQVLSYPEVSLAQKLQIYFFLQDLRGEKHLSEIEELITSLIQLDDLIHCLAEIEIVSCKKRVLAEVRRIIPEWFALLEGVLFHLDQATLRDYVLGELLTEENNHPLVRNKLTDLCQKPHLHPDIFFWYFQKVMGPKAVPFSDHAGKVLFFESFLILLSRIEHLPEHRELVKKMHAIMTDGRFAIVRALMQEASAEEVKEFLLLATKCHSITDHDSKILHSLAEVAHPSLGKAKKATKSSLDADKEPSILWSTEAGYEKMKQRIQQIATVDTVENAKEIEIARAHGDLRENAEFKAALEKRDRLQSELKTLSHQLQQARILSAQDVSTEEVGVGTVVYCTNAQGKEIVYTLLGPWDADPEKNIIASQSKLAQNMQGSKVGESISVQGETLTITRIGSYF